MFIELSDDTKAVLLLTAPLGLRKGPKTTSPLTWKEYTKLASSLQEQNRRPADLLNGGAYDFLDEELLPLKSGHINCLLDRGFQLSRIVERWRTRGIWAISVYDACYPSRLKDRLGSRAPPLLYGCGDARILDGGGLAVVGSRKVDEEKIEYSNAIGRLAAKSQWPIVSGGARGVDQAAMSGCLTSGGMALGVLSERLESVAMSFQNRQPLMDNQLVVVSPYDPQAGFNVGNAMRRNKMIYALADAGLIVESAYGKGGTWSGAVEQLDRLRLVPVYVRRSDGRNRVVRSLVSKGALVWPEPQTRGEFNEVLQEAKRLSENRILDHSLFHQSKKTVADMDMRDVEKQVSSHSAESTDVNINSGEQYSFGISKKPDGDPDKVFSEPFDHAKSKVDSRVSSASNSLYAEVERLLALLPTPIIGEEVHTYLGVGKQQATKWMMRLVEDGKYLRYSRPRVTYRRISES